MKHFTAFLLFIACLSVKAQTDSTNLVGTWELVSHTYGNPPQSQGFGIKRYKIITPTHFVVTDIDPETNVTKTSIMGTYSFSNGVYKEKILHVTETAKFMIGSEFSFLIKFDQEDAMSQVGSFNNMNTAENWKRVKSL
jgi:hypothetical protein